MKTFYLKTSLFLVLINILSEIQCQTISSIEPITLVLVSECTSSQYFNTVLLQCLQCPENSLSTDGMAHFYFVFIFTF
jgi:hypothetical protein